MTYSRRGRPLRLDDLPPRRAQRPQAARHLARPVAQLRRRPPVATASATSSAAPSTSASPTSTWPTTTARRPAAPRRNFGRILATDFTRPPRRARHLHQGRLPHVARPVRRVGLPQVPGRARSTSRCGGWASTTSTSSTTTAPTRTPRSRRPWAPSTPWSAPARPSTSGISNYTSEQTAQAAAILQELGTPLLIHQPSYSILNRWIEQDHLLDTLETRRRRLHRVQPAAAGPAHRPLPGRHPRRLPGAHQRLPQRERPGRHDHGAGSTRSTTSPAAAARPWPRLALAWALRDPRMTSLIIGASSVDQLETNIAALDNLDPDRRRTGRHRRHRPGPVTDGKDLSGVVSIHGPLDRRVGARAERRPAG